MGQTSSHVHAGSQLQVQNGDVTITLILKRNKTRQEFKIVIVLL